MTWYNLPLEALAALSLVVVARLLLLASRERVCTALDIARTGGGSRGHLLSASCVVDVPNFTVALVAGALALVSITLSRCEYSYDHMRASEKLRHRCGHSLAAPASLSVLWYFGGVSFALHMLVLPSYICAGTLVMVLHSICEGGTPLISDSHAFFSGFAAPPGAAGHTSGVLSELAAISPNAYCNAHGGETPALHACAYFAAAAVAAIGQVGMVSSLGAEWERASEELHYMQLDGAGASAHESNADGVHGASGAPPLGSARQGQDGTAAGFFHGGMQRHMHSGC